MAGQVLRRDEADAKNIGDPHEIWYRFDGREVGFTGNNGTMDVDYATSIEKRSVQPYRNGPFRFDGEHAIVHADFAQSLTPYNSFGQGAAGGSHTVRAGDTLQSIARQLWGDSSLWYKLAEANGMSAGAALAEGQSLTIPSGVARSGHSASTFQPYDPSEVIGDVSPTDPKPQKNNRCGMMGSVLIAVVAAAVASPHFSSVLGRRSGAEEVACLTAPRSGRRMAWHRRRDSALEH